MNRRRSIPPLVAVAVLLVGIGALQASAQQPVPPAETSVVCLRALEQADTALRALARALEADDPGASLTKSHANDAVLFYAATRDACRARS